MHPYIAPCAHSLTVMLFAVIAAAAALNLTHKCGK
jgi:hypothetical protein